MSVQSAPVQTDEQDTGTEDDMMGSIGSLGGTRIRAHSASRKSSGDSHKSDREDTTTSTPRPRIKVYVYEHDTPDSKASGLASPASSPLALVPQLVHGLRAHLRSTASSASSASSVELRDSPRFRNSYSEAQLHPAHGEHLSISPCISPSPDSLHPTSAHRYTATYTTVGVKPDDANAAEHNFGTVLLDGQMYLSGSLASWRQLQAENGNLDRGSFAGVSMADNDMTGVGILWYRDANPALNKWLEADLALVTASPAEEYVRKRLPKSQQSIAGVMTISTAEELEEAGKNHVDKDDDMNADSKYPSWHARPMIPEDTATDWGTLKEIGHLPDKWEIAAILEASGASERQETATGAKGKEAA